MIRFKELREEKKLLQKDIANLLNVSQQHYSRLEKHENELDYDGLNKLANFYNTNIDYLLGFTNEKKAHKKSIQN